MAKSKKSQRRANGSGSVFQRKNGKWAGAITIGYDDSGVQKKKVVYGNTREEVEEKLKMLDNRIKSNSFEKLENSSAAELMREWLVVFKKNVVLPKTFYGDLIIFTKHIEPHLKNLRIQDVDDIVIQQILNKMIDADYSLSMVKKVKFLFNNFLDYAEAAKWIAYNPSHRVQVRIKDKKIYTGQNKYKALTPEKRTEFLKTLDEDPKKFLKALCYTLMFSGLRIGEALGLQWKNVDLVNKTINVEQAANLVPKFDKNLKAKMITQIGGTKTACSIRELPLPDILVEVLGEWKVKQENFGKELGKDFISPNSFVFCADDGGVRTYNSCRLSFNRFKKAHNFENLKITFHGLRHTFSNMLFEANENPKVIQQLLGHKDVRTTISVYNSVDKDYVRKSTQVFNNMFKVENPKFVNQEEPNTNETHYDEMSDQELEQMLKEIERAQRRKKQKDFEM